MKKNVMMRVASIMLVLVLMTSSVISGTFAKYVTADDASDTARVAKFGVVATVDGTLFAKNYVDVSGGNTPADTGELTVKSQSDAKVVAPGTKNAEGMTITLTGKPEVDVAVEFKFEAAHEIKLDEGTEFDNPTTGLVDDNYTVDADYYPVIFTLVDGNGNVLANGNVAAIQTYLATLTKTYDAGTDLSKIVTGNAGIYTLTWEWAFQNAVADVDVKDTYLGNAAAAKYFGASFPTEGTDLAMDVTFSLSVTQVD